MVYSLTDQNLVIVLGGHSTPGTVTKIDNGRGLPRTKNGTLGPGKPGLGTQRHYPIFMTEDGGEWISLNGQTLVKVSSLNLDQHARRERVVRG